MKLNFQGGIVRNKELKTFFFPTNYWIHFFRFFEEEYSKDSNSILLNAGIDDGIRMRELKFDECIKSLNYLGIGTIEYKRINNRIIQMKIQERFSQKILKNKKENSKLLIENIHLGIIKGYFLSNNKKVVIEKISKNKIEKKYLIKIDENKKSKKVIEYDFSKHSSFKTYSFLKNIIIKGNLTYNNGELFLFKMNGIALPINLILNLIPKRNILDLGYSQGVISAEMHLKKFGNKSKEKIFENIVNLSDISGLGKFEIISSSFPIKIKYSSSFDEVDNSNKQKYIEHICELVLGMSEEIFETGCEYSLKGDIIKINKNDKIKLSKHKRILSLNLNNI